MLGWRTFKGSLFQPSPPGWPGSESDLSADQEELSVTLVLFPTLLTLDNPDPNNCEVPVSWASVITVSQSKGKSALVFWDTLPSRPKESLKGSSYEAS